MNFETLAEHARTLRADEFEARYRGFFLAREQASQDFESGMFTTIEDVDAKQPDLTPAWEIIRVTKALWNSQTPGALSVGRARNCDIVLRNSAASKVHAYLREIGEHDRVELVDNGSSNGTRVDGRRLSSRATEIVRVGSVLDFGGVSTVLLNEKGLYALIFSLGTR